VLVLHAIPVSRVRLLNVVSVFMELSFRSFEHDVKPIFSFAQLVASLVDI
jgi:hypothetical protein